MESKKLKLSENPQNSKEMLAQIEAYLNDETPILSSQLKQVMGMVKEYGLRRMHEGYDNGN